MKKIINVYGRCMEYSTIRVESTVYNNVVSVFDFKYEDKLKEFNWCYETSKGVLYTMDLTMKTATLLGCAGPKFYLQKYVAWLETGNNKVVWLRKHKWDYRVAHGRMVQL